MKRKWLVTWLGVTTEGRTASGRCIYVTEGRLTEEEVREVEADAVAQHPVEKLRSALVSGIYELDWTLE